MKPLHTHLSRRMSQIMDIIYRLGEASVSDVVNNLPDDPDYHAIRVTIANLEKKGYLTHRQEGQRYIYRPVDSPEQASRNAMRHLVKTFYGGAPGKAILTLLDLSTRDIPEEDLDEIARWIEKAKEQKQ